jgi:hypothetical protein
MKGYQGQPKDCRPVATPRAVLTTPPGFHGDKTQVIFLPPRPILLAQQLHHQILIAIQAGEK